MANQPAGRVVVSMMKNEGPYVLEWVAYHRHVGFTDFLVYSNDCTDGTELILDRLAKNGVLTHVRNRVLKRGPQKSALKYARDHALVENAEWVFVCDIDEFLNIRIGDGRLDDLLAAYPDADAIPVAWRMFSWAGQTALPEGLTLETFTDAEPECRDASEKARFVKTLFRPCRGVVRLGTHGPIHEAAVAGNVVWRSPALDAEPGGDPLRPPAHIGHGAAQVNHYAVRALESFLVKRDRGRVNHVDQVMGLDYWMRWNLGGSEDGSILRHLPGVRAELAQLRADPVLRHLETGAREWHAARVAELSARPDFAELRAAILAATGTGGGARPKLPPVPGEADDPAERARRAVASAGNDLALKAPMRHQKRLEMLARMPRGGRCAEIGVWNGGFSAAILDVTEPQELVLIDPWDLLARQDDGEWTHARHQDAAFMAGMHDNVRALYGTRPNVTIRRGFSAEVLEDYPDDYFDWVYIDGNHLYDFVRADLSVSHRKVRAGGIIAGDDFFWKRDGRMHVREAVLDTLREWGTPRRPERIGQQFMIRVEK